MKCNFEWLSAYLDGVLAEDKRAKLEEHLKTCEACTAKLEEFARVEKAAKKISAPQLSEAYWENFANRVQNKLTIREKQKTSPGWLETLKSFFQPTAGKLAIAGSVVVIVLLTFVSLDQWKKQTFRPPVFEAEKPVTEVKVDSVKAQTKDESAFRTVEKDNKVGLVEDKRLDQPAREGGTATLSQKPTENAPAASAPVGRMLAAPEGQKSKEEPSLATFAERDEAIKGDTGVVAAGKKAEETEKAFLQSRTNLQKRSLIASPTKGQIQSSEANDTIASSVEVEENNATDLKKVVAKPATPKSVQEFSLIKGGINAQYGSDSTKFQESESLTSIQEFVFYSDGGLRARQVILRDSISKNERLLSDSLHKDSLESIYILLGRQYLRLYKLSAKSEDWKTANKQLGKLLKKELSDSSRQRLLQIQAELKKPKK